MRSCAPEGAPGGLGCARPLRQTVGALAQPRVALFSLQRQLSDSDRQPDMLLCQARFALAALVDRKGLGGMRQALIASWVIRGLTDLVCVATFRHGCPLEAFKAGHDFGVGVPLASVHGCPPFLSATVYSVPGPLGLLGSSIR